jgi:glycopeptide antibiotics resistance protein
LKKKYSLFLLYSCLFYVFCILFIGIWPFNLFAENGVSRLNEQNGIAFNKHGIVFSRVEDPNGAPVSFFGKESAISIELWLKPESDVLKRSAYIFCIFDEQLPEIFSLAQVKSSLKISIPEKINPTSKWSWLENELFRGKNWRWLHQIFFKGQKIFLTLSSGKNVTTVYLNGKVANTYRNYSLAPGRQLSPTWHMIIGNNPAGQKPWHGHVYGMAIYNQALTSEKVYDHYQKWQRNDILSLSKEIGAVALYPMDEHNAGVIHNIAYDRYHLVIPGQFKGLKKNFLKLSANALNLSLKSFQDMSINIIGFIPFGYLFFKLTQSLRYRKSQMWQLVIMTVFAGAVLSLIVEMSQTFLPTRYSSITDFIFNVFGTAIGASIAVTLCKKSVRNSFANSHKI